MDTTTETRTGTMPEMTFEAAKQKAWTISETFLRQWQERLSTRLSTKAHGINQHLKDLSLLYGEPVPKSIIVSLQYYPRNGTQKGEPVDYLVEIGKLPARIADILYWISTPYLKPTDTPQDIRSRYQQQTGLAVRYILHEIQHHNFQTLKNRQLFHKAEQLPKNSRHIVQASQNKRVYRNH